MNVGEVLNRIRKEKKMTLLELSQKSGVALATLSRIENDKMTGTLDSHMNICKAFEMTLPELYRELPSSKKTVEVQQKTAKRDIYIHNKKSSSEILASNARNKKMMPILIRIA
ncbi:MAG: helix-turn-helix transcriptional regulator, partial [Candidatus Omnitrophota bacterium]|nr:helix-turn-helix transcriptional regulator [Candidatus Omnitrophota bacterium]